MNSSENFRRLLRDAHAETGKGVLAFEHALGMPGGALKAILDPKQNQMPRLDKAERIASALGLEFYIGPKRDAEVEVPTIELDAADFSTIPLMNVSVSAGNGMIVTEPEDEEARLAFSRKWLLSNRVEAKQSILVRVTGDSMAPTVPDKAVVLVDRSGASVRKEGIYAIHYDGVVQIKRLVPIPPQKGDTWSGVVVVSDNHAYPPSTIIGPDQHGLRIIGRVRACLTAMP